MVAAIKRITRAVAVGSTAVGGLSGAHLMLLLGAAVLGRGSCAAQASDELTFAIVIPAHDEEHQIAATIRTLEATAYPPARRRIVVVADNCTDATAQVAREAGADVLERHDPARRGKGHALAWAFPRILEDARIEAVCIVDADCEVSANLLRAFSGRLRAGADAVQARYFISDPTASTGAALRWAGFALFNVVRPRGRERLGVSAGMLGTGAAFSRGLLARSPWRAFSFAEDREQHMRWVLDGARVAFADEAEVRAPAAAGADDSRRQESRWDSGRGRLAAGLSPLLLARSARRRDFSALDAALEPVLPPQSLLLAINVVAIAASSVAGSPTARRGATASLASQAAYVVLGLTALRAPSAVWRAFAQLPWFVARRWSGLAGAVIGRGPTEWVRTPRRLTNATEGKAQ
jgi:1,2-diacylglycerol 3-beta-glucosyltransferase